MRSLILSAAVLVVVAGLGGSAEAASWAMAGSGCQVDRADVAADNYQQFGAGIEFRSTIVGDITVYCPVTVGELILEGSGYLIELYYQDQNTSGERVLLEFFKMNLTTGSVTGVEGCESIDSAAESSATGWNRISDTCTHTFNPNTYSYFFRVRLERNTTNASVRLYGMSIYGGP